MHESMCRVQHGAFVYYTCKRLPVRHAFTTKFGGVSEGHLAELNLGFSLGDKEENVRTNYDRLAKEIGVPLERMTMTKQIHEDEVSVATKNEIGMGLHKPFAWQSDAIVTAVLDAPLIGYYADCVVTLLYDPVTHTAGVCHSGWRGTAKGILQKTVDKMVEALGTKRESLIAVMGPSIHQDCFETDSDVPEEMRRQLGDLVDPFIQKREEKFHIDLQKINGTLLEKAGLYTENIIDSGICTMCQSEEFWSHRKTNGKRGVQGGLICL